MAAHIIRSARFPNSALSNTPPVVGPGSYTHNLVIEDHRVGYAPFSQKAERFQDLTSWTPGPGAYDDYKKTITLAQTNPLSSFASTEERFHPQVKKRDPGPGSYSLDLGWEKPSFRVDTGHVDTTPSESAISPYSTSPSIPTPNQSYGYEDGKDGLRMKKPPFLGHTGKGKDTVGPGEYPIEEYVNKMNYYSKPQIGFSKSPRSKISINPNPGVGAYDPQFPRESDKLLLPSTVFRSKTTRDFTGKSKTPGPGAYHIPTSLLKPLPEEHVQAFGTLAPRMTEIGGGGGGGGGGGRHDGLKNVQKGTPGPGAYNEPRSIHIPPPAAHSFNSTAERFARTDTMPLGPGQYDPSVPRYKPASRTISAFGSLSSRFNPTGTPDTNTPAAVGPGSYTHEDSLVTIFRKKQPSSFFTNAAPRFRPLTTDNNIGPGEYNTATSTLNLPSQTTLQGTILPSASFLAVDRNKAPSSTGMKGGTGGIGGSGWGTPGPGQYEASGSIHVKEQNHYSGFMSTDKRFKNKFPDIPGVGTYNFDSNLLQRSFNRTITTQ